MKKILVTYVTFSDSTAKVAQTIGEDLAGEGVLVDMLPSNKSPHSIRTQPSS